SNNVFILVGIFIFNIYIIFILYEELSLHMHEQQTGGILTHLFQLIKFFLFLPRQEYIEEHNQTYLDKFEIDKKAMLWSKVLQVYPLTLYGMHAKFRVVSKGLALAFITSLYSWYRKFGNDKNNEGEFGMKNPNRKNIIIDVDGMQDLLHLKYYNHHYKSQYGAFLQIWVEDIKNFGILFQIDMVALVVWITLLITIWAILCIDLIMTLTQF
ncbi:hypothetical protein ACJX0J_022483, partial [Zea mays]